MRASLIIVLVASALLFASCDSFTDDGMPTEATVILGVKVTPQPIPAGAEATIRVSVLDSTAAGISYNWDWEGFGFANTSLPVYVWKAPDQPGEYRFEITVSRTGGSGLGYRNVGTVLHLTVVPKP